MVVKVHIGESTLSRRISEFSSTQVASQTMSGFEADVMALEAEEQAAEQGQALLGGPESQGLDDGEGSLIQLGSCSHTGEAELHGGLVCVCGLMVVREVMLVSGAVCDSRCHACLLGRCLLGWHNLYSGLLQTCVWLSARACCRSQ